jgi:hypothetical protein
VHVSRATQRMPASLRGERQPPLVGAHCVAEPTLGDPDVGLDEGTADDGGEVTSPLQARHALGIQAVRCLEIPGRPGNESQQPRCRTTSGKIILADEVEHPPGMGHGAGHIAHGHGLGRTVEGDRTR